MHSLFHSDVEIWNTGLYIRLSAEDERKKRSGSVETQKSLLLNYIQDKPDLFLYAIYVDVDQTGANFDRPDFQRLMDDVKAKRVNCIVVKDLSRFGRNFLESSEYVEKIFPDLGVRFISINDNYDSFNSEIDESMGIALKNLLNDIVIKDLSKRMKSTLPIVMREGYFRGGFPPYGYISERDENEKRHLFIDQEAARVVRQIFQWRIDGAGYRKIAERLNDAKIAPPLRRLQQNGFYNAQKHCSDLWSQDSVRKIITNPVYMGHMVQHRFEVTEISSRKIRKVPPEEWICVPNTHEAIISPEQFEKAKQIAQNRAESRSNTSVPTESVVKTPNLLKGLVRCNKCGGSMYRVAELSKTKKYYLYYFLCSTYNNKAACVSLRIREEKILKAVMDTLASHVSLIQLIEKKISALKEKSEECVQMQKTETTKLKRAISTLKTSKVSLYDRLVEGRITEQEYLIQKQNIENNIMNAEKEMDLLLEYPELKIEMSEADRQWIDFIKSIKRKRKLTYEQIHALVQEIRIEDAQHIEIKLASSPFLEDFIKEGL